ncbi:hypothetical protein R1sor_007401 [Riccia sorocarpa]|uniref:Uncharacterized protein n=1 Tax=Riccia sorocarpa TaxID=122646 RepID=A0ABD3HQD1_9MARC
MIRQDYEAVLAYIEDPENFYQKEIEKGMTIDDKLEKMCPHFRRMYTIFGQRTNITPPAEESCGLPDDIDMFDLDSQPSRAGEFVSRAEEFAEEEEEVSLDENDEIDLTEGNNSRDLEGGSDDDGDEILDFMSGDLDEDENQGIQDENPEIGNQEGRTPVAAAKEAEKEEINGENRSRREKRSVQSSRNSRPNNQRDTGDSRSGTSEVTKSKSNLLSLYEEGPWNKLEYRKQFIEYRYANLAEKRSVEAKRRRCQLVIELRKEGLTMQEIEEYIKFVDAD